MNSTKAHQEGSFNEVPLWALQPDIQQSQKHRYFDYKLQLTERNILQDSANIKTDAYLMYQQIWLHFAK